MVEARWGGLARGEGNKDFVKEEGRFVDDGWIPPDGKGDPVQAATGVVGILDGGFHVLHIRGEGKVGGIEFPRVALEPAILGGGVRGRRGPYVTPEFRCEGGHGIGFADDFAHGIAEVGQGW